MICCPRQHFTALFLLPQNAFAPLSLILYIYLCSIYYAINTLTRTHSHPRDTPRIFAVHYERVNSQGLGAREKWWGHTPARPHARENTPERARKTPRMPADRPENDRLTDTTAQNAPKPPQKATQPPEPPRAYAISKVYITYFLHKISKI